MFNVSSINSTTLASDVVREPVTVWKISWQIARSRLSKRGNPLPEMDDIQDTQWQLWDHCFYHLHQSGLALILICWIVLFSWFMSLLQSFSHTPTWKLEIPNLWSSSGDSGNRTPHPLLGKPDLHLSRSLFSYFNYLVSVTAGGSRSPWGHMKPCSTVDFGRFVVFWEHQNFPW